MPIRPEPTRTRPATRHNGGHGENERERRIREEERIAFLCGGPHGTASGAFLTALTAGLVLATATSAFV